MPFSRSSPITFTITKEPLNGLYLVAEGTHLDLMVNLAGRCILMLRPYALFSLGFY